MFACKKSSGVKKKKDMLAKKMNYQVLVGDAQVQYSGQARGSNLTKYILSFLQRTGHIHYLTQREGQSLFCSVGSWIWESETKKTLSDHVCMTSFLQTSENSLTILKKWKPFYFPSFFTSHTKIKSCFLVENFKTIINKRDLRSIAIWSSRLFTHGAV